MKMNNSKQMPFIIMTIPSFPKKNLHCKCTGPNRTSNEIVAFEIQPRDNFSR